MSEVNSGEVSVEISLRNVEILGYSVDREAIPEAPVHSFSFNIELKHKIDTIKGTFYIIVHVGVSEEGRERQLGSATVGCDYHIANFSKIVSSDKEGKIGIPHSLNEILNSISISTARGIMVTMFKGTFLHNAILPIVDPTKIVPNQ